MLRAYSGRLARRALTSWGPKIAGYARQRASSAFRRTWRSFRTRRSARRAPARRLTRRSGRTSSGVTRYTYNPQAFADKFKSVFTTFTVDTATLLAGATDVLTHLLISTINAGTTNPNERDYNYVDITGVKLDITARCVQSDQGPMVLHVALVSNKQGSSDSATFILQMFNNVNSVAGQGLSFNNALFTTHPHKRNWYPLNKSKYEIHFHKRYILQQPHIASGADVGRSGTMKFGLSTRVISVWIPHKKHYKIDTASPTNDIELGLLMWIAPLEHQVTVAQVTTGVTLMYNVKTYFMNQN